MSQGRPPPVPSIRVRLWPSRAGGLESARARPELETDPSGCDVNEYSPTWFETYLGEDGGPDPRPELAFVKRHLPLPRFRRLLDVACGPGRHAGPLADAGYRVLGVDRSAEVVARARQRAPGAEFVQLDMESLGSLPGTFDGALCLWQSFGYGTDAENGAVLRAIGGHLRKGGRFLLDVYNRQALPAAEEVSAETRGGRSVRARKVLEGKRFRVFLEYEGTPDRDEFDWRVYTPRELEALLEACGLTPLLSCAWFDEARLPGPAAFRMQLLSEVP